MVKDNKMSNMKEGKLLMITSVPIMISMLIQALYNIVDSHFVSKIGQDAFNSVSLAFPVQMIMISVAVGTGIGMNSLISRRLGEQRFDDANSAAENGIFLSALNGIIFAIFGIFFSYKFILIFTDNVNIIDMGSNYLKISTLFSFSIFIQITMERIMQSTGNSFYSMIVQAIGAIINIILDPILILGYFGLPKLGVSGAAIASVIGQTTAMLLGLYINMKKNDKIDIRLKGFKINLNIIKEIYIVGIPAIIMSSITSFMTIGLNKILASFSQNAISVLGAYFKLQSFIFMPAFGFTSGMISIVGYNFGAKNKKRIVKTIYITIIVVASIMLFGTILFQIMPRQLLIIFNVNNDVVDIGVKALRIISISFIFAGINIVFCSVFQAIGKAFFSLIISLIRQLIVILPVAFIMSKLFGITYLWTAFPISETTAFISCIFICSSVYKKYIKNLQ